MGKSPLMMVIHASALALYQRDSTPAGEIVPDLRE
jgi:hypothetical protein